MDAFDELGEWLEENTKSFKGHTEGVEMTDKAMRICDNKGFQLDLPNGITVSVQFGPGNYCDRDVANAPFDAPQKAIDSDKHWGSNLAECAAYLTSGDNLQWVDVPGFTGPIGEDDSDTFYDDVVGYLDVQGVLDFINLASQLKPGPSGDYRYDPKIQADERRVMDELAIDEFFSGLVKFSGTKYKDN